MSTDQEELKRSPVPEPVEGRVVRGKSGFWI
jgi:hypothetical protein